MLFLRLSKRYESVLCVYHHLLYPAWAVESTWLPCMPSICVRVCARLSYLFGWYRWCWADKFLVLWEINRCKMCMTGQSKLKRKAERVREEQKSVWEIIVANNGWDGKRAYKGCCSCHIEYNSLQAKACVNFNKVHIHMHGTSCVFTYFV